jgi:hypothetical protein
MDVTATLGLPNADTAELARIIGCDEGELEDVLAAYATAALEEYTTMFLGQKVFKRGSDLLEYRLCLLIKHAFDNRIPDESQVSRLFQISATESRSLIRSVMSKYQYLLHSAIERSVVMTLDSAAPAEDGGPYLATINNANIVEALNLALAEIDGTLKQVSKQRGSVSTFEIAPASYARLRERFNPGQ